MESVAKLTALINQGGTLGWALAVVGGFALLCALFVLFGSVLKAPSTVVRFFSMSCLLLSLGTSGLGVASMFTRQQDTERAVRGMKPAQAERVERQIYAEARAGLTLAIPMAGPPILLALLGLIVAGRRRLDEDHDRPPGSATFAVMLMLFDLAAVGGAVWLYRQPLPGRDLDDQGWQVQDLKDALDANDWARCLTTAWQLPQGSKAQGMGAHADNQRRCVEHFEAEGELESLEQLEQAKWLDDARLKPQLTARIAQLKAAAEPPAEALAAAPAPGPDAADVLAQVHTCFEQAVKKKPGSTLSTTLHLEVTAAGKVRAVTDSGAGKPDATRKCAVASVKKLKLKPGEARELDVPINLP